VGKREQTLQLGVSDTKKELFLLTSLDKSVVNCPSRRQYNAPGETSTNPSSPSSLLSSESESSNFLLVGLTEVRAKYDWLDVGFGVVFQKECVSSHDPRILFLFLFYLVQKKRASSQRISSKID
jgi:hypothetical protein